MSGVKGKSGKASTAERRAAKRKAGRMGGLAKAGHNQSSSEAMGFGVSGWIDLKDKLACDLSDRKIIAADIEIETLLAKLDQERGKLLTRQQVEDRDEKSDEIIFGHLDGFVKFVGDLFPPELGAAMRQKTQGWLTETRSKIYADLRASR